jgi:EAL and modified HD-GYP domain-containing signal transduction protein
MNEHPVLGQVALGYCPMIDRERKVSATRVTVFPQRPDQALDAQALLQALLEVWPGGEALQLNAASEPLLRELLELAPPRLALEVPAFLAADPGLGATFEALHARGVTLLLSGRPAQVLPPGLQACFRQAIVDLSGEQRVRGAAALGRSLPFVQSGVRSVAQVEQSFARGATAVLGWPIDEAVGHGTGKAGHDLQVIVELINRVDRQESIDRLEATLTNDPTLAFRLVRYINSAAFGLRVEIGSFRHAIMMLGYQKLKRWLALLLASSSANPDLRPVMYAAVRRGLFMEELVRSAGDEQMGSELFICGVFSLLDVMMGQPFAQLLRSIPVPQNVADALVQSGGRHRPYLELARAIEQESLFDIRETAEALMLAPAEVNRALLRALVVARQLE